MGHKIDPETETIGGNAILDENANLHHQWDDIPTDIGEAATRELLADARAVLANPRLEALPTATGYEF